MGCLGRHHGQGQSMFIASRGPMTLRQVRCKSHPLRIHYLSDSSHATISSLTTIAPHNTTLKYRVAPGTTKQTYKYRVAPGLTEVFSDIKKGYIPISFKKLFAPP